MAFFDDMAEAVQTYPASNVTIAITDFAIAEDDGDVLNVGEDATFTVTITNNGLLDLTDVTVRVTAENGALLRTPIDIPQGPSSPGVPAAAIVATPGNTATELESAVIARIGGNGRSRVTETFRLIAPQQPTNPASVRLVAASLKKWDADLSHILVDRSDPVSSVQGSQSAVVHPL